MKAIRNLLHRPRQCNTKPSRIVIKATTGEKGQRIIAIRIDEVWRIRAKLTMAYGQMARRLCDKMGWKGELIGGGFPDGTMVWVFAHSMDRA